MNILGSKINLRWCGVVRPAHGGAQYFKLQTSNFTRFTRFTRRSLGVGGSNFKLQTSNFPPLLLLFLPCLLAAQNDRAVIDRVVGTVGSEIILLSEVQEQLAYARQQQPTLGDEYRCVSLQNLVVQRLLVNQAKLDSVEVKDEEVETQLAARIDRLLDYFNQDQKALEEYYGQTIDQIRDQYRTDMRGQLLAERMQAKVTEKATITPAEVQVFFANIPKDSLPYFNAEVEIREIAYKPPVNEAEMYKARVRIDDLRTRIVGGKEDFAELAKKYSDDPGSGQQGGD